MTSSLAITGVALQASPRRRVHRPARLCLSRQMRASLLCRIFSTPFLIPIRPECRWPERQAGLAIFPRFGQNDISTTAFPKELRCSAEQSSLESSDSLHPACLPRRGLPPHHQPRNEPSPTRVRATSADIGFKPVQERRLSYHVTHSRSVLLSGSNEDTSVLHGQGSGQGGGTSEVLMSEGTRCGEPRKLQRGSSHTTTTPPSDKRPPASTPT